jgi:hypothetical protein
MMNTRSGECILDIARSVKYPPYLLLRDLVTLILPQVAKAKRKLDDALLHGDQRLRLEIMRCQDEDLDYAPMADRIRHTAGLEFEYKLQHELRASGILFEHEDDLRVRGFHKTPDALLPIPVGLLTCKLNPPTSVNKDPFKQSQAHVIRWIDSKAMFGDYHTHTGESIKEQLQGYVNRYGPGLVIYWFGYDPKVVSAYPDVYVASEFPYDAMVSL